jgi:hypothetical protein
LNLSYSEEVIRILKAGFGYDRMSELFTRCSSSGSAAINTCRERGCRKASKGRGLEVEGKIAVNRNGENH